MYALYRLQKNSNKAEDEMHVRGCTSTKRLVAIALRWPGHMSNSKRIRRSRYSRLVLPGKDDEERDENERIALRLVYHLLRQSISFNSAFREER